MEYTFSDGALVELTAMSDLGNTFAGWQGDLAGQQNPIQIIMDSGKSVIALFTQDAPPPPPPNTDRTLSVTVQGQGNVMVNQIVQPPTGLYDFTVPGDFPDIPGIDWNQVVGKTGLVSGTYQGSQEIDGANNVTLMFQNFILENGSGRGLNLDNSDNLTLKAVNSDPNNFRIRNFGGKHLRGERLNNLVVDGVWCETGNTGGQTDTIYIQRTDGLTVRNSKLIINAEAGGHNDIIQMFEVGGNVLIENNVGLQNNSKTTNNQGIYATTPRSTGNYKYLNNFISGTTKSGGLSAVKNCLTLQRLPSLGGSDVPIVVRGNKVRSSGYKFVWLEGITNYNADIYTANDVDTNQIVIDV